MVSTVELFIGLLAALSILAVLGRRLGVPTPIFLVAAGVVLGYIPGVPHIKLEPEVVLIVFLPPLVYRAGVGISWHDFCRNLRPIVLLAVGCVIFTAVATAYLTHAFIPAIPLAACFVLGAAISPPDAVAATSIANRLGIPRRIVTILEGEGVVNDATALTIYKVAIVGATLGAFSARSAVLTFGVVVVAEIFWGYVVGRFFTWLWPKVHDTSVEVTMSLIVPYVAYLVPEQLGGSGVLAAVTAGFVIGARGISALAYRTRIQGQSFWLTTQFVFENLLFLLTGLQLRGILNGVNDQPASVIVRCAVVVTFCVLATRFLWVFPAIYVPRWFSRHLRETDPAPKWQVPFFIAFTGLRGGVSLAAAMAIPLTMESGAPFPQRDLILLLVFSVIFVTLVLQGLLLPWIIRWLGLSADGALEVKALKVQEIEVRIAATEAALQRADAIDLKSASVRREYSKRESLLHCMLNGDPAAEVEKEIAFRCELLWAERAHIVKLRHAGTMNDAMLRRLEQELDLDEARLVAKLGADEA